MRAPTGRPHRLLQPYKCGSPTAVQCNEAVYQCSVFLWSIEGICEHISTLGDRGALCTACIVSTVLYEGQEGSPV